MCDMSDTVDLPTDDLYNLLCYGLATDRTGIRLRFAFCDCCRKTITPRISTTSTVITRQCLTYFNFFFVYFDFKLLARYTQKDSG